MSYILSIANVEPKSLYEFNPNLLDSSLIEKIIVYSNKLQKQKETKQTFLFENSDLSLFINYRLFNLQKDEGSLQKSLNSRVFYSQRFAENLIQWQTVYETNSGQLPQQDFTYVQVEPGQGTFVWFDYNDNGIQEFDEFSQLDQVYRAVVPDGMYFVMGDNRDRSSDSRIWGFVPRDNFFGKAEYIWMSWECWTCLPSFSRAGKIN